MHWQLLRTSADPDCIYCQGKGYIYQTGWLNSEPCNCEPPCDDCGRLPLPEPHYCAKHEEALSYRQETFA